MNWHFYPITELAQRAETWDAINATAGGAPFLDSRFVLPLCATFAGGNLKLALLEIAGQPVAMGVVAKKGPMRWETFQPSQSPLGLWVLKPGCDVEGLLEGLTRHLPGFAVAVGITQQDPARTARPAESPHLQTLDYIKTAWVPIAGTFEEYWRARGKNLRHNMKRQRAKLAQDGVATRLEVLTRPEDVASAIEDYGRLESAGWKAGGGTAVHAENAQGRFYREMLESFCRAGLGRIYRYSIGGKVAAIDLCIEGRGALVILKTTYDETMKALSPAFLMREEVFKTLFDEPKMIKRIEFFGKLQEWHLRWTSEVRTLYHANYYRFAFLPRLKSALGRGVQPGAAATALMPWIFLPASAFGDYLQSWESILSERRKTPVLESAFIRAVVNVFATRREILAICGDAKAPRAMAILSPSRVGGWQTFQPSQEPLSAWAHRPGADYEQLMSSLIAALPRSPFVFAVTQKDPDIHPPPEESAHLRLLDYIRTARIAVDRPFEDYWRSRDKKVRYEIRRRLRRLQDIGIVPRLDLLRDPADVAPAIEIYAELESKGWKGKAGTAVRADNSQGAFYRAVLEEYCAKGKGRIYLYRFGDDVAAMQLCISNSDTLVFLKTAYREQYRRFGPGILLKQAIFERIFREGRFRTIEFYGSMLPWQEKWASETRTLYHVNYYRWPFLAKLKEARRASARKRPTTVTS